MVASLIFILPLSRSAKTWRNLLEMPDSGLVNGYFVLVWPVDRISDVICTMGFGYNNLIQILLFNCALVLFDRNLYTKYVWRYYPRRQSTGYTE